jgi:hypothetical protein
MILLTVLEKIGGCLGLENAVLAELVDILPHNFGSLHLLVVLDLQQQPVHLQIGSEIVQQLSVCVFLQQLFDNKRGLGDSPLAEVNAGQQTKRHPLPTSAFTALHNMLIGQIVFELPRVDISQTIMHQVIVRVQPDALAEVVVGLLQKGFTVAEVYLVDGQIVISEAYLL